MNSNSTHSTDWFTLKGLATMVKDYITKVIPSDVEWVTCQMTSNNHKNNCKYYIINIPKKDEVFDIRDCYCFVCFSSIFMALFHLKELLTKYTVTVPLYDESGCIALIILFSITSSEPKRGWKCSKIKGKYCFFTPLK